VFTAAKHPRQLWGRHSLQGATPQKTRSRPAFIRRLQKDNVMAARSTSTKQGTRYCYLETDRETQRPKERDRETETLLAGCDSVLVRDAASTLSINKLPAEHLRLSLPVRSSYSKYNRSNQHGVTANATRERMYVHRRWFASPESGTCSLYTAADRHIS